jgi:Zn-dependent protease
MTGRFGVGIALAIVGVIFIVRALTAEYLYNDTEGPIPVEDIRKYKARPRDRLLGVCLGILCIVLGLFNMLHR